MYSHIMPYRNKSNLTTIKKVISVSPFKALDLSHHTKCQIKPYTINFSNRDIPKIFQPPPPTPMEGGLCYRGCQNIFSKKATRVWTPPMQSSKVRTDLGCGVGGRGM